MSANRSLFVLLLLSVAVFELPAQQSEADRKFVAEVRARAEKGDAQYEHLLGVAFELGLGGEAKDGVEAAKWYRKAAEQNYAKGQYDLGRCYAFGIGVEQHDVEAVKWYRKAAEQGYAPAQCLLAGSYSDGTGVEKNPVEAVKWYRKAAEQGYAPAQCSLSAYYMEGKSVAKNPVEAVKWIRKAAEQNDFIGQGELGVAYLLGLGVTKDEGEGVKWIRTAAQQNSPKAEFDLGLCYSEGKGVEKNQVEAVKWIRKAAEQNWATAQSKLAEYCVAGNRVLKDQVEGYKWLLLAAAQGDETAKKNVSVLENWLTREEVADGQKLARNFKPRTVPSARGDSSSAGIAQSRPESSGTGFFITEDGYLITNAHVVGDGAQLRLVTADGLISAKVVRVDVANDIALLKADGKFTALPVASSRTVQLGGAVATVGFPNIGLQGFAPKFSRGEIGSLSGPQDDARYFQISVPVQPGNSGGALVNEHGNVVGVVSAKLNAKTALLTSGQLPENVNYAVKSSFLLGFLESVPEVAAKLKEPNTKDVKFSDVVEQAKNAAVLVLVY